MTTKRTRRASRSFQNTKTSEDVFTSGDKLAFAIDFPSLKGRVTRSRHSPTWMNLPTNRRQTMLPALKKISQSPVKQAPKAKNVEHLLKTPSNGIGTTNFCASPANVDPIKPPNEADLQDWASQ